MMMFIIVLYLEYLYLPELCSYSDEAVILLNMIHVNMQHIRVKLAFSIVEKLACRILDEDFKPLPVLRIFQVNFVNVQLRIIPTDNKVVIVIELELQ